MTLHMLESADPIKVENVVIHIFSDPGVGRTTLGNTTDKPLLVDYDRGVHRSLGRQRVAQLDSWEETEALLKHPWFDECNTLVLDTVGRGVELLARSVIMNEAKCGTLSSGPNQHGFGVIRNRFVSFFSEIRSRRKNVVLLSHAKLDKDKDGNKTATPDIMGGSAGEVFKVSDAIGYLNVVGGRRILDFNISENHIGKNPPAWAPFVVPEHAKAPRFLQDQVISALIAHLNTLSEEQTSVLREFGEWQARIEGLDPDPQTLTDMIPALERIEHPAVKAQAKGALARRAKLLGFTWDKEPKAYTKPVPAKAETKFMEPVGVAK